MLRTLYVRFNKYINLTLKLVRFSKYILIFDPRHTIKIYIV